MDIENEKELPKVATRSHHLDGKGLMEEEKSKFERVTHIIKRTLFSTLYVLVRDGDSSFIISIIFTVIQFVQLHTFIFRPEFKSSWNEDRITTKITQIIDFTLVYPYFRGSNWNMIISIFYFFNAFVFLIILNALLVGFLSRKSHQIQWPIQTLRFLIWLSKTILYLPILQIYFSVFSCQSVEDKMLHVDFKEVVCWKGMHVLHSLLSMVFIILFLIISLITSLTYFDCKPNKFDPHAKTDGRLEFTLLVYQASLFIVFAFLNTVDFRYILLVVILAGAIVMFKRAYLKSPFQNEVIRQLWVCLSACFLWSSAMLGVSIILEKNLIQGTLIMWIIGLPFIYGIFVFRGDSRIRLLLVDINKFNSGDELNDQINYILKLIIIQSNRSKEKEALLLDGFIETHKRICATKGVMTKREENA